MNHSDLLVKLDNALNAVKKLIPDTPIVIVAAFPPSDGNQSVLLSGGNMSCEAQKLMLSLLFDGNDVSYQKPH